ncbi:MAG: aminoglycoside phosphotransferase family protein [Legionellaceae bacterium]|nr:aminoglycoside phosphotransferase family protein [Legionellaceae bacterium]
MTNPDHPLYLDGGRHNKIIRIGNEVHRPAGPWTKKVQKFLQSLREENFFEAPIPLGFDSSGLEIVSFIDGEVSNYPLSRNAASINALISAAKLLRRYHDASQCFLKQLKIDPECWQLPSRKPKEVICHGDFAPYNVVLNGEEAIGIIDFDTCHPGPRVCDIAYALYRWAPFTNPNNHDGFGNITSQIKRALIFCNAYGLSQEDRRGISDVMIQRLESLVQYILNTSEEDHCIRAEHLKLYLADIEYIDEHKKNINFELSEKQDNAKIIKD